MIRTYFNFREHLIKFVIVEHLSFNFCKKLSFEDFYEKELNPTSKCIPGLTHILRNYILNRAGNFGPARWDPFATSNIKYKKLLLNYCCLSWIYNSWSIQKKVTFI